MRIRKLEIKKMYIADTPGFSSLDISNYSKEDVKDYIRSLFN